MNLCNTRNKIIKLFEDKNIKSRDNTYHAKPEPEPRIQTESESRLESRSELQLFEESRAGRAKLRRQKIPIKKIKKDKD